MFEGSGPPEKTQAYLDEVSDHGSIFVARVDRKLLHPEHVRALVEYLASIGAESSEDTLWSMTEYMDSLSKKDFIKFWNTWVKKHPKAKNIPSPYEV